MLAIISGYLKSLNETKQMSFLIKDDELLKKYNKTQDKYSNSIKKGFDSKQNMEWKISKN